LSAQDDHGSDQGTMDISDHVRTWNGFLALVKWVVIGNIALLAFLAAFRTHN
jgi:hypothetical protein